MSDNNTPADRGDELEAKTKSPLDDAGKPAEGEKGAAKDDDAKAGDEGVETPEEKAERERLEAEEKAKKNIRIPKYRFDEAQEKARRREAALQEEITKLKAGQATSAGQKAEGELRKKIDELSDKYEDLITDGKKDEARKVRKQLEEARETLLEHRTTTKSDAARNAAIAELKFDSALAGVEAKYAELNPDHDSYDEDKTNEVAALMDMMIKSGVQRAKALNDAVKYVMGPEKAAGKDDGDKTKQTAQERAEAARKKAAEADKKQPANTNKTGLDSDKAGKSGEGNGVDVMRLSQKDFAKLDEDTLAKLRGDTVDA